jgi:hypothetical protein
MKSVRKKTKTTVRAQASRKAWRTRKQMIAARSPGFVAVPDWHKQIDMMLPTPKYQTLALPNPFDEMDR